jgi:hypothetical protein
VKPSPIAAVVFALGAVACAERDDADTRAPPPPDAGFDVEVCFRNNGGDDDQDGFDESEDCDDCEPDANPGALDAPGNGSDEDCSGVADDGEALCDADLDLDASDAELAARALGLCRKVGADERAWGLISAAFVKPDGDPLPDPLSHGLLPSFGNNLPRHGERLLALSTGSARAPDMPGYQDILGYRKGYTSGTPEGYPKESPACPGTESGAAHDGAALELVVRVPTNVKSLEVSSNFFTLEFPGYVCSKYNDFFVIDLSPKVPEYDDGNIAFDGVGNPISVNNTLLQVCLAQKAGNRDYACPLGTEQLTGTGFDTVVDEFSPAPHAATGWLRTRAPIVAGSTIRLRFAIWDSADGNLDSTVLIDDFKWSLSNDGGTEPVPR